MKKIITILIFITYQLSGNALAAENKLIENTYDGMINQDVIGRIFYNDLYVLRVFKDGAYHLARRSQNSGEESVALASGFQCFSGELKHSQFNGTDNSTITTIYKDGKPIDCSIEGFTKGSISKKTFQLKSFNKSLTATKLPEKIKWATFK